MTDDIEYAKKYNAWMKEMPQEPTEESKEHLSEPMNISNEEFNKEKEKTVFEASDEQYQKWEEETWQQD